MVGLGRALIGLLMGMTIVSGRVVLPNTSYLFKFVSIGRYAVAQPFVVCQIFDSPPRRRRRPFRPKLKVGS